jgi:hypothetical protein
MRPVRSSVAALALSGLLLSLPCVADAIPVVDFNLSAPTSGTIRHDGGGTPLTGQNLTVDDVVGLETPGNADVALTILAGKLSFTTGSRVLTDVRHWYFAPGGSFTVTGRLDLNGNDVADASEPVEILFEGEFTDVVTVSAVTSSFRVIAGSFAGTLSPTLASFYGLVDDATYDGGINLSFTSTRLPPLSFLSTQPLSGDVAVTAPVPEPMTLLLLGSGMVAAGAAARRRRNAQPD